MKNLQTLLRWLVIEMKGVSEQAAKLTSQYVEIRHKSMQKCSDKDDIVDNFEDLAEMNNISIRKSLAVARLKAATCTYKQIYTILDAEEKKLYYQTMKSGLQEVLENLRAQQEEIGLAWCDTEIHSILRRVAADFRIKM
jgi:hypothetical protein